MGRLDQLVAGLGRQSADSQQGSVFLDLATTVIRGHPGGLASLLPALVDHLTPNGQVETPLTPSLDPRHGRFNV